MPATGSVNEKVLPWPGSLSTQMCPPWYSTISLQIGKPKARAFGLVGQRVAHLLEFLEDFWLIRGSNADARVGDADDHSRRRAAARSR